MESEFLWHSRVWPIIVFDDVLRSTQAPKGAALSRTAVDPMKFPAPATGSYPYVSGAIISAATKWNDSKGRPCKPNFSGPDSALFRVLPSMDVAPNRCYSGKNLN